MRFRAFLSYSHADAAWARWLLRRLETYRVPSRLVGTPGAHGPIERRLGTFFLDRDELPSAGDLGATIREALAESAALVVIASPAASQSRWVNAEVEAFQANGRGDRVLSFVVDGVPGSANPAQNCFPPALVRPDAEGNAREPLAADARPEGDGRQRAFLKLVAGLLGIGYDALARREAQRRTRKLTIVATASMAGMAIALGLAASAYVARNDAQRRQAQAEDILGFMLGDLRKKLTTVGRLDLMRAVDDKATGYFSTLDPRDLSDRALEEQARSLSGIGQVRLDEGNHDAAMAAFREAHARSSALLDRQPGNGQRLFDLAQAEYWIGAVAFEQGRYDDAGTWFRKYRDSALRLAAMDRRNFAWQQEVAYGYSNLASLDERRGRYAEGEQAMRKVLALRREWAHAQPGDTALLLGVADSASWLGSLTAQQGKLAQAEEFFKEQVAALSRNIDLEPKNADWRNEQAKALLHLARIQANRGRRAEARASVEGSLQLASALVRQDPSNNDWRPDPGICRWWQAQLAAAERDSSAEALAVEAAAIFESAVAAEPKDDLLRHWLAKARLLQAQLSLANGNIDAAAAQLAKAAAYISLTGQPDESLLQLQAERLLLAGEVAQRRGDQQSATRSWQQAERLLLADADTRLPFDRLDPLVRTLRRLGHEEQAVPHQQRLVAAGYVPLRPWPTPESGSRKKSKQERAESAATTQIAATRP
ncbi:MAG: toll/interleukin-1 receptor domain-containing protein [Pseudoxanthomonas sp.]